MQVIKKFPKSYFEEAAQIILLANTPRSMFRGLQKSEVVGFLQEEYSETELRKAFSAITSKGNQSPTTIGASYALLVAILLKFGADKCPPEMSRLRLADDFMEAAEDLAPSPSRIIIPSMSSLSSTQTEVLNF